jgi:hypothetical protein
VAVFDPLAVMMLLAATESMTWTRKRLPEPVAVPPAVSKYQPRVRKLRNRLRRKRKKMIDQPKDLDQKKTEPVLEEESEDYPDESAAVKEAKRRWKANNPDKTLKEQRHLLSQGLIDRLPWEDNLSEVENVPFGQILPDNPVKGYQFLHTGYIPSRLFKYNGNKWIEVDKSLTDSYAYNNAYIEYLVDKIDRGEYDPELLSPAEQQQIELKLTPKG